MKHFLAVSDLSSGEVQELLDVAIKLKEEYFKKGNPPYFKGKVLGMIFQKPSLRTRVSFDMAMRHCGGDALYLSPAEIGLGKREAIGDVAQVLSSMCDLIVVRTFAHRIVNALAVSRMYPLPAIAIDIGTGTQDMREMGGLRKKMPITFLAMFVSTLAIAGVPFACL